MSTRLSRHPAGLHLGLMLALTLSTGIIDGVGFLGLDRVFTGNMTGNVVILAMALTGGTGLPIFGPVVALACFLLGATAAGRTLAAAPAGWSPRSTVLFTAVGTILAAAAGASLVPDRATVLKLAITGALGLAMGMQTGAARHIGVKDVTTVVVTSTLAGLAFDSRFGGNAQQQWKRRLGAVLLIASGAAVGALLMRVNLAVPLALSSAISFVVALLGHFGRPQTVTEAENMSIR